YTGVSAGYLMYRNTISRFPDTGQIFFQHQFVQHFIFLIIYQQPAGFYHPYKKAELFKVKIKCWKYIDMVPCNAGQHSNMREQKVKFWPFFQGAGGILVAFTYDYWCVGNGNRIFKSGKFS